jgi:hypothetical protein
MTPKALKRMSTKSLVQLFAEAAAANGRAWEEVKPRIANKQYEIRAGVYRELRSRGIDAQRELLSLLDHPNPYVRCLSAARALEFEPKAAEPVLQALEILPGLVGHNAEMTLKVWRKGELRFP